MPNKTIRYVIFQKKYQKTDYKLDCCICQESFKNGCLTIETKCKHLFCIECLKQALTFKGTCPTCRKSLLDHTNKSEDQIKKDVENLFIDDRNWLKRRTDDLNAFMIKDHKNKDESDSDTDYDYKEQEPPDDTPDNSQSIMGFLEDNPDIDEEHREAESRLNETNNETNYDNNDETNYDDNEINYNMHEDFINLEPTKTYLEYPVNGRDPFPEPPHWQNHFEEYDYMFNKQIQMIQQISSTEGHYNDNNDDILKAISLSTKCYQEEEKYNYEMTKIISLQKSQIDNQNKNKYQTNILTAIKQSQDVIPETLMLKIAMEESLETHKKLISSTNSHKNKKNKTNKTGRKQMPKLGVVGGYQELDRSLSAQ